METLVFETALGHTALARRDSVVHALTFGHTNDRAAMKAITKVLQPIQGVDAAQHFAPADFIAPGEDPLIDRICEFAAGEPGDFDDLLLESRHLTPFGRKVTAACRRIPWGETLTYGQLAKRAGRPGAARAVGSVMARNRVPLIVPCHRVVPASGGLGGFSAPQGVSMKRRLLDMEQPAKSLVTL